MSKLIESLEKYLKETPKEKVQADWDKSKKYDKVGISVEDYLRFVGVPPNNYDVIEHFKELSQKRISEGESEADMPYGGNLELYMKCVKSRLECNGADIEKQGVIYTYSNEEVDAHHNYFEATMNACIGAYKALLFFHDYLQEVKLQR